MGGCRGVEAVAVLEEVKGLGEVLADFGGVGLLGGSLLWVMGCWGQRGLGCQDGWC